MNLLDRARMAIKECLRVAEEGGRESTYLDEYFSEHWTGNFEKELEILLDLLDKEVNSSYCPSCEKEVDTEYSYYKDVLEHDGLHYSVYLTICKECARPLDKSSWVE